MAASVSGEAEAVVLQFSVLNGEAKEKSLSASRTDWPRSTYLILLRGRFWIVLFLCDSMRRNSAV